MSTIANQNYRGSYHFSPKANWMNDPNGMVYFKGEYHLFYQYHPSGLTWGPMHWGHAVSRDLVSWEELDIALIPDQHGMIFSGSAVVDWHNTTGFFEEEPGLVAIFTHHAEGQQRPHAVQYQSLAYSKDQGRTWIKYEGNPVLRHETFVDFRDPKVFWHAPTSQWVMIVACGQSVCLYHSTNLKDWSLSSEFGEGIGFHGGVWECPDLFPLPVDGAEDQTKWVMLVSIGDHADYPEGSRTQYFTGDFDGRQFVPDVLSCEKIRWLDYGRDNYAGVSWSDVPEEDGRRLFIGWMSNWKYANMTPTEGWRGAMTLVRELALRTIEGEVKLAQQPAAELSAYRKPVLSLRSMTAEEMAEQLSGLRLESYEIEAELNASHSADIKVRVGEGHETIIGYRSVDSEIYIDRTRSGLIGFHDEFSGRHSASVSRGDGRIEVRIFVDRSSVEVFVNGGESVLTDLIYPGAAATGLSLAAEDCQLMIPVLRIYDLSV
ncbi:glycoside hydrolase family 32 protein [Paenibacillus sp. JX-17]|uniref:Glycoside hydrolase family 32 protein n=1 Tax=Paenibacillus lacisoli TaxID=3064525 RepID=A0ABT9CLC8_9BACL|nr:glycoside hydrolase family 32 protein [Paenibacillus sp. JX-17]MDO7908727.1 glycoside hydrolase family 32 protein [Paenibacillus sp. JX-17]